MNIKDKTGMTPLHLPESDLMNLCDQGANLNIQDDDGEVYDTPNLESTEEQAVSIRGADNVGEVALEVIPGQPLDYSWEGHGLRLHIPANALQPNTPLLTMRIQTSLSALFQLPNDMELVSGVYWISFPVKSLVQPVTLELQHCIHLEHTEETYLTFVTSKCNQETLPYQFEPLPGGVFTTTSDYGAVQLYHFSGVAVARKKRRRTQSRSREQEGDTDDKSAEESVAKKYVALTYYKQARSQTTWEMHFTIIPNLDIRLKTLEKYYPKEEVESSLRKTVVFERDTVTLVIPEDGIKLSSGWSIVPMAHPASLMRSEVDSYVDTIPPSCQLELHLQGNEQPYERLSHHIKVTGIQGISSITVTRDVDLNSELSAGAIGLGKRKHELEGESSTGTKRLKPDGKPTLPELLRFSLADEKRINIAKEIGDEYKCFGTLLLEDETGQKVKNMESKHHSDPSKINTLILEEWLNGKGKKPVTWAILVEVLHDTELSTLANNISTIKCPTFEQ